MRNKEFVDYELIDASCGERLERWGKVILIRPDPQVIWQTPRENKLWEEAGAVYHRSSAGGGAWEILGEVPVSWEIGYSKFRFKVKTMGFKHTGVFPEQATNWDFITDKVKRSGKGQDFKVLNLFAYTGGATLAALGGGANVCHVDASKGMVQWARENAAISGFAQSPVRWLVDDCTKFVQREIRRGNKYDAIIMDPPSYGRGPGGEIWKLEESLFNFVELCEQLLGDGASFMMINSYTTGLAAGVMEYLLSAIVKRKHGGRVSSGEIGLKVTETGLILPCGATAVWERCV